MPKQPTVEEFLAQLEHPLLDEIHELRQLILSIDSSIKEAIKWNAPSFYTTEHFATMRLHGKQPLQLILHLGVAKQALPSGTIDDPTGLLTWLAADRATVTFTHAGAVAAIREPLSAIIRQWIRYVPKAMESAS